MKKDSTMGNKEKAEPKSRSLEAPKNRHPFKNRFIVFSIVLFLVILASGVTAFLFSMRQIIRANNGAVLSRMLEIQKIEIEETVKVEIAIALKLANSPLIRRYFADPSDLDMEKLAFEEIASYSDAFSSSIIFWVNDIDKMFHYENNDPYWIDDERPENYWYNMTLYETEVYNFNINYNPDLNIINLWINAPVYDNEHKAIGMVGTGIGLSEIIDSIYNKVSDREELYFINGNGEITGAGDIALVERKESIEDEITHLGVDILTIIKSLSPGEIKTFDTSTGKIAVGSIPLMEWYSIAILPDSIDDYNTTMTALFIIMFVLILLIFIVFNIFIARFLKSLQKTMENLEAANEAKSRFLANMSHEIRTPMNSIVGFSDLAIEEAISPKTKEYLGRIRENSKWLLQIINDILDISKIESGNMELENIPFDLHELLAVCKNIVLPKAIEKNIALYFYAESVVKNKLYGDPTRLRQVLLNLLSNAVKFTEDGKVSLVTSVRSVAEDAVTLQFEVKDSGIGMTPEQIAIIFEPFMQADISTTRRYGGTGLGLPITKKILELMGSSMEIESAPGAGTTISFTVTVKTVEGTDDLLVVGDEADELEKPLFKGEVLVCEDNKMNQQVITEHLARVGITAEIAENGQEGIEKIKQRMEKGDKPYDLIFMDIHMPVMDGIEATPKIIGLGSGAPVVAMTANIMTEDRELYKTLGMNEFVGKPFTSQELWRCLLKYLKPISFAASDNDDNELQKQLKMEFVNSNRGKYGELAKAIDSGDISLAHRLTHSLKSNAGLIGKAELQRAAADVESALKDGGNLTTAAQMDRLRDELAVVLDDFKQYLSDAANPVPAEAPDREIDVGKTRELFEKLELLLNSGSPESLKLVDCLSGIPGSEELIEQIEDFNFGDAEKTLSELKGRIGIQRNE